ncbi:MAG: NAD(P)H-quinone oxidoreductase [Proteobacteria bacterium]|nr:NAD(P)H-quinone oxidoreductase [Pseudomonadota bacterium]
MNVVEIREPGGPEVLQLGSRPTPQPGHGEILIAVAAAGLNRADCLQRSGSYPPPPGATDILGLEASGTVAAIGPGVTRFAPGDEVCALINGGGYAQYCLAPADNALPLPQGVDVIAGGALPEVYFTVWANVYDRAWLKDGECLLVHGGSSGIGTAAIQLANALGSRVFATAGTADKCAACEALGAERAINYHDEDFVEVITELTGGKGVDVILDMVAGEYLARNLTALAVGGRLVHVAMQAGHRVDVSLAPLMVKGAYITGSRLRPRSIEEKAQIAQQLEQIAWPLLANGSIKPVIDSTFALGDAARAHAHMESSRHIGKILLTP